LIPEFSLPGTSIGTAEANEYMKLRHEGVSQKEASKVFISLGMSSKYGITLEKKMRSAEVKSKAIFPDEKEILHNPMILYQSQEDHDPPVILTVNYLFLARGFNPLFFSRNNILRIREIRMGKISPLDREAIWSEKEKLDSG
jgi:hypothetical protein